MNSLGIKALLGSLAFAACLVAGCSKPGPGTSAPHTATNGGEQVVNLYIWADDMAPDTVSSFEQLTGIKVHVSYFDSPETLESRILMGSSG
ncbi:MAG: potF, partial [Gammaproteobacteria bacterium]|nr:potF [Gammaproteobacteria bacterium]